MQGGLLDPALLHETLQRLQLPTEAAASRRIELAVLEILTGDQINNLVSLGTAPSSLKLEGAVRLENSSYTQVSLAPVSPIL